MRTGPFASGVLPAATVNSTATVSPGEIGRVRFWICRNLVGLAGFCELSQTPAAGARVTGRVSGAAGAEGDGAPAGVLAGAPDAALDGAPEADGEPVRTAGDGGADGVTTGTGPLLQPIVPICSPT